MAKVLDQLKKPPLIEAIFEVRFAPKKPATGDLLPGLLYPKLGEYYTNSQPLPLANVPRQIRDSDPNLRYRALHQLTGTTRQLHVGDRVVSINQKYPYEGWHVFRENIQELIGTLQAINMVEKVERYSLKYVNVISVPENHQISSLNTRFELASQAVPEKGFQFRTEFESAPWVSIVQIVTNASVKTKLEGTRRGLLVEVDTIRMKEPEALFSDVPNCLEDAHDNIKELFVSLLTPETLRNLEPVWREE